jgi:hypothetical protein
VQAKLALLPNHQPIITKLNPGFKNIQVTLTCCPSLFNTDKPKGYGNKKAQAQRLF